MTGVIQLFEAPVESGMNDDPLFSQPLENLLPPEDPNKKPRGRVVQKATARRVPDAQEYAADRVNGPAIGLIVTSSISIVLLCLGLALDIWSLSTGEVDDEPAKPGLPRETTVHIRMGWSALIVASNLVTVWGAVRMLSLKNMALCRTACILAVVPCVGPCFFIGLPFGIWGLKALHDSEVRSEFTRWNRD